MSKTFRNTTFANPYAREIRHINYLRAELAAQEELIDEGYSVSNRLRLAKGRIKTNYDDLPVSALSEQYSNILEV